MPGMSEREKNGSVGEVARNSTCSASVVEITAGTLLTRLLPTHSRPSRCEVDRDDTSVPGRDMGRLDTRSAARFSAERTAPFD
jgi:hypothetical protein